MKLAHALIEIIRMPFKASSFYSSIQMLLRFFHGILPVIKIFIMSKLIDNIIASFSHIETISAWYVFLFAIIITFERLGSSLDNVIGAKLKDSIWKRSTQELVESWGKTKYENIENEQYYTVFERVKEKTEERIYKNFISFLGLVTLIINIATILGYISSFSLIAGLCMLALFSLLVCVSIYGGRIEYKASVEAKKAQIKTDYFDGILTDKASSAERNVFAYDKDVALRWEQSYNSSSIAKLNAERVFLSQYQTVGAIGVLISSVMIFIFCILLYNKLIGYGIFAALVANIVSMTKNVSSSANVLIRELVKSVNYVNDYETITKLQNESCPSSNVEDFDTIEVKNLWFKYSNTQYILKGLNLTIEKGKHYAIVGENGTGKTTLLKLLTGLYRNYEGSIQVNGKELKDNPELYGLFGVVFQDYAQYNLSLRDNLTIGCVGKAANDTRIKEVLRDYNIEYITDRMTQGLDTMLGKQLSNSENLSGGEWQKIALARLELSEKQIKILDEPTASLDPIAESKVYSKILQRNEKNTYLIVSHRLGITALVDRIYVIADGIVSEAGTSDELKSKNGVYMHMYKEQSGWYQK